MRKDPFGDGSYVHITKRGARGMPIVRDDADRWRFVRLLRYLNDRGVPKQWDRDITQEMLRDNFARPEHWRPVELLVEIVAFCLLDNHFHILIHVLKAEDIPLFMQKLGDAMTCHFNNKYAERGSIFQGAYHLRTIPTDELLAYVATYIQVKNVFDVLGVKDAARMMFDQHFDAAMRYPFSSLPEYMGVRSLPCITKKILISRWDTVSKFRSFAKEFVEGRKHLEEHIRDYWCE